MITYSVAEAAEQLGAPSERWLVDQLRAGRFPGRKVGRRWRMTDSDIRDTLDTCHNGARRAVEVSVIGSSGLTPTSRKKVIGM